MGLIGSEDNPANDRVWAVLAVGVVGALIARFRPRGLSLVMLAVAACQVGLALYADATGQDLPLRITVVFVTGWLVAAALFDRAARER